jgi:lysophospholipase L1-like esterase
VNLTRIRRGGAAVAAAIMLAVAGSGPAVAAPPTRLAATGDSYAAGVGAGNILDGCGRTDAGYAALLGASPNLGCSGATTGDVLASQVPSIPGNATDVTLTVGANDIGVGAVSEACYPDPRTVTCGLALAAAEARIPGVASKVQSVVTAIRGQAKRAKVVVTGYPHLFAPNPNTLTDEYVNASIDALNYSIYLGALRGGASYVDVVGSFSGHEIGSSDPWINGTDSPSAFHPNAAGYVAYANAIRPRL